VPVHSDIADPVRRLKAVHADSRSARRGAEIFGRGYLQVVVEQLPHVAAEALMRYFVYPQLNVTVSNIRGPEATLYVAGARLVHFYPVSIATDWIGLNHTGFSYNGVLWISAVACRNMMPDPDFYAGCLRASFEELMAALEALPKPAKARTRAVPAPAVPAPAVRAARRPAARKPGAIAQAAAPRRRKAAGR
jgi:hypothetical protein